MGNLNFGKILLFIIVIPLVLFLFLENNIPLGIRSICDNEYNEIWLVFWANYFGACISVFVSLYILKKTIVFNKKSNHEIQIKDDKRFRYQVEKHNLDNIIESAIELISCYNHNNFAEIYNKWINTNEHEECKILIKELMDKAFLAFEKFTMHFAVEDLKNDKFLLQQDSNYKLLISLCMDMQILVSIDNSFWNKKDEIKKIYYSKLRSDPLSIPKASNYLLKIINDENDKDIYSQLILSYSKKISINEVERQMRDFIDTRRKEISKLIY